MTFLKRKPAPATPALEVLAADFATRRAALEGTRADALAKLATIDANRGELALAAAESGNGARARLSAVDAEAADLRAAVEHAVLALDALEKQQRAAVAAESEKFIADGVKRLRTLQKQMDREIREVLDAADALAAAVSAFTTTATEAQRLSLDLQRAGVETERSHFNGRASIVATYSALAHLIFARLAPLAAGGVPQITATELQRSRAHLGL